MCLEQLLSDSLDSTYLLGLEFWHQGFVSYVFRNGKIKEFLHVTPGPFTQAILTKKKNL